MSSLNMCMFKKIAIALVLSLMGVQAMAAPQAASRPITACSDQVPYGWPQVNAANTTPICRTAYALLHDNQAKVALWVVYTLTPQHAIGCEPRTNAFAPDQSLPQGQRSELADYAHSGYDTGHIANDGDMSWDPTVERESFILSNMAPQLPNLNRGIWKLLESSVRSWTYSQQHAHTVYAGSIYNYAADKKVGPDNVVVPHGFYKIVIDDVTHKSYAFLFPHSANLGTDISSVQVTVADVERASGIVFPVPDNKTVKNALPQADFGGFTKAKQAACPKNPN